MTVDALTRTRIQGWTNAIEALTSAAHQWQRRATTLETAADDYVRQMSSPAGTAWRGAAQQTALEQAHRDRVAVISTADRSRVTANVALHGSATLRATRAQALSAIAAAEGNGFVVTDDLSVRDVGVRSVAAFARRMELARAHERVIAVRARELLAADQRVAGQLNSAAADLNAARPQEWGTVDEAPHYKWTAEDLYRGNPTAKDVQQDALGDCYLAGALGAVADANPQWIRDRIKFDPHTGNFEVTLWDGQQWKQIAVSQEDINTNIAVRGASSLDNGRPGAALWPAVLETAYAKLKAPEMSVRDALVTGIHGGRSYEALEALTGNSGHTVDPRALWSNTVRLDREISDALAENRPVIISSTPEGGLLAGRHCYIVESITGTGSDAQVTIRNPWNGPNPVMTLPLDALVGHGIPTLTGTHPTDEVTIGRF